MKKQELTITPALIQKYAAFLHEQERSSATIQKYVHDLTALGDFLAGQPMTKGLLLEWKENLIGQYAPASVNNKLAAINGFLAFCGLNELRLRKLKIQRALFLSEDKELTRAEYVRLVKAAERSGIGAALHHRRGRPGRAHRCKQQGQAALCVSPGQAAETAPRLSPKTKNHRRSGVPLKKRAAFGSIQHLAGYEVPVRERRGGAIQGIPPQFAPPLCPHLLCPGA